MSCIKVPSSKETVSLRSSDDLIIEKNALLQKQLAYIANNAFGCKQWSHSVSNHSVDFVEFVMGKYLVGCVTTVKVQLNDGTFHEAVDYGRAESTDKGLAIHKARSLSQIRAFKMALTFFGEEVASEIEKISNNVNTKIRDKEKVYRKETAAVVDNNIVDDEVLAAFAFPIPNAESTPVRTNSPTTSTAETVRISEKNQISSIEPVKQNTNQTNSDSAMFARTINEVKPLPRKQNLAKSVIASTKSSVPSESKRPVTDFITEEEQRQERKRRQKEKQEQYRKLFMEKQRCTEEALKSTSTSNVKF